MQTRRVLKIGGSYGVTLPLSMLVDLGLQRGDYVEVELAPYLQRPAIILRKRPSNPSRPSFVPAPPARLKRVK